MEKDVKIWAVREGRRKPFPSGLWARMPAHRWGWVEEEPERPAVLVSLPTAAAAPSAEKAKRPAKKQRKIEK